MRNPKITFACGVVLSAIAASGVVTNVWQGSENGGMWNVPDNWTKTLTPTEETVYDFSGLADGAEVTNDYRYAAGQHEQLKIAGLIFGKNKGTVALVGTADSETVFQETSFFDVPSGTVFDCRLRHTNSPWAKDPYANLAFYSEGEVRFSGTSFVATIWKFIFSTSNQSVVFGGVGDSFRMTRLWFTNSVKRVTVQVEGNATFADVFDGNWPNSWPVDANKIIGDGDSVLTITSGYGFGTACSDITDTKVIPLYIANTYTMFTNFQSVAFSGGGISLQRGPILSKQYVFRNFDVRYGREYTKQGNPVNNVAGGLKLLPCAAVDLDGSAQVETFCNQELSTLSGIGTHGRFDIGGSWTDSTGVQVIPGSLTVGAGLTAPTATVFNARLTGIGGGFVKKGVDYDLTLTGANTYTGATQVAEGRLTLKRPCYDTSMLWYSFDEDDQTLQKAGPLGYSLAFTPASGHHVSPANDGVRQSRAVYLDGEKGASVELAKSSAIVSGNQPHTIQFWIRPEEGKCDRMTYVMDYGTHWGGDFTRSRVLLYRVNATSNDDYLLIFTAMNNNTEAVPPEYGVNVSMDKEELFDGKWHQITYVYGRENRLLEAYFDGVLKGVGVLSSDMSLPEQARCVIGYSSSAKNHYYTGGIDEVKIIPKALTQEAILRGMVFADIQSPLSVPDPIIHWAFENESEVGKDECGVANLVLTTPSTSVLTDQVCAKNGKALSKNIALKTERWPECMPVKNESFTVSCRYKPHGPVGNSPILWWGNPDVANGYLRIQTSQTEIRSPGVGYSLAKSFSATWNGYSYGNPNIGHTVAVPATNSAQWTDFAVVWNGKANKLRMYVDGALVGENKNVALNISKGDALHIGYQTIGGTTTYFPGLIDDIQIFDRALTDDEVRLVVRKLHNETPVRIIENSSVTVSQGATLAFDGPGHELENLSVESGTLHLEFGADFTPTAGVFSIGALTGAGILNLAENRICQVSAASGFYGTVRMSSGARFEMDSDGGSMSADVYAENGACFKAAAVAPIRTSGRIVLPSEATVMLDSVDCDDFPLNILEASRITKGDVVWNFVDSQGIPLLSDRYKVCETDSGLSVKMRKGTTVIIR